MFRNTLALLAGLALAVPAAAQQRAELQQRLARIAELRRAAASALAREQAARREPLDTITVGSLRVVSRSADADLVRRGARTAWLKLDSLYGVAATDLASTPFLFRLQDHPPRDMDSATARLQQVIAAADAGPDGVASQLVRGAGLALRVRTDTVVANWLGPQLLVDVPLAPLRSQVYVELVTTPSIAVRGCYAGDLEACGDALGLIDRNRITAWYDATQRRALVQQDRDVPGLGLHRATRACLEEGADSACVEVLDALKLPPPLSYEARQLLVRVALDAGGPQAFRRLTQRTRESLARRLAAASGLQIADLLGRWRAAIIAAQPHPVALDVASAWTALGWSIVFGLLALRSTRWR